MCTHNTSPAVFFCSYPEHDFPAHSVWAVPSAARPTMVSCALRTNATRASTSAASCRAGSRSTCCPATSTCRPTRLVCVDGVNLESIGTVFNSPPSSYANRQYWCAKSFCATWRSPMWPCPACPCCHWNMCVQLLGGGAGWSTLLFSWGSDTGQ